MGKQASAIKNLGAFKKINQRYADRKKPTQFEYLINNRPWMVKQRLRGSIFNLDPGYLKIGKMFYNNRFGFKCRFDSNALEKQI